MASQRWKGPDVLVIGWIPFAISAPSAPGYPPGLATTLLFQSGNPQPPIGFAGYAGFSNWLFPKNPIGTKEYRAAVYMDGVVAEFFDDGSPPRIDYGGKHAFMGYTPLRLYIGGINVAAAWPQVFQYKKGTGPRYSPVSHIDSTGQWAELRYRAEFKLSWLTNVLSRIVTQAWAPYAWCEVFYRFYAHGKVEIRVDGSAITNQWLYTDWTVPAAGPGITPQHDMLGASAAQVLGFLQTVGWGCRPAPQASQLFWTGQAATW
jgi:hypothetical protein